MPGEMKSPDATKSKKEAAAVTGMAVLTTPKLEKSPSRRGKGEAGPSDGDDNNSKAGGSALAILSKEGKAGPSAKGEGDAPEAKGGESGRHSVQATLKQDGSIDRSAVKRSPRVMSLAKEAIVKAKEKDAGMRGATAITQRDKRPADEKGSDEVERGKEGGTDKAPRKRKGSEAGSQGKKEQSKKKKKKGSKGDAVQGPPLPSAAEIALPFATVKRVAREIEVGGRGREGGAAAGAGAGAGAGAAGGEGEGGGAEVGEREADGKADGGETGGKGTSSSSHVGGLHISAEAVQLIAHATVSSDPLPSLPPSLPPLSLSTCAPFPSLPPSLAICPVDPSRLWAPQAFALSLLLLVQS